jgi:hypothetical protein
MKRIIIAAVLIFSTGIITSNVKADNTKAAKTPIVDMTGFKKDLGSAD